MRWCSRILGGLSRCRGFKFQARSLESPLFVGQVESEKPPVAGLWAGSLKAQQTHPGVDLGDRFPTGHGYCSITPSRLICLLGCLRNRLDRLLVRKPSQLGHQANWTSPSTCASGSLHDLVVCGLDEMNAGAISGRLKGDKISAI